MLGPEVEQKSGVFQKKQYSRLWSTGLKLKIGNLKSKFCDGCHLKTGGRIALEINCSGTVHNAAWFFHHGPKTRYKISISARH